MCHFNILRPAFGIASPQRIIHIYYRDDDAVRWRPQCGCDDGDDGDDSGTDGTCLRMPVAYALLDIPACRAFSWPRAARVQFQLYQIVLT